MARDLDLLVVAEGVETQEEADFLREHHCNEAQGYYFGEPTPPQKFAKLLKGGMWGSKAEPTQNFDSRALAKSSMSESIR
jgi:diguanylate cyclase